MARRRSIGPSPQKAALLALCVAGAANALYMLAYHLRITRTIWCPVFGDGCAIAGRSKQARHLGLPNAAIGVAGYIAVATLAAAPVGPPKARSYPPAGAAFAAFVASLLLFGEQAVRVRRFCFWCVTSVFINAAILPLALIQGHRMARR